MVPPPRYSMRLAAALAVLYFSFLFFSLNWKSIQHMGPGESSLLLAAEEGDLATVSRLWNMGVDVNARGMHGMTALLWATERGHLSVVAFLCSLPKTQLRVRESLYGRTALDTAKIFLKRGKDLSRKRILRILQSTQESRCLASSLAGGSLVTVEFGVPSRALRKNLSLALSACTPEDVKALLDAYLSRGVSRRQRLLQRGKALNEGRVLSEFSQPGVPMVLRLSQRA